MGVSAGRLSAGRSAGLGSVSADCHSLPYFGHDCCTRDWRWRITLPAIMSMLLPAAAIIPLHGLVQLGSNANRAAFTAKHIRWQTLYWFAPGVVLGALLASALLVELPPA